jgi:hypothetical protein
MAPLPDRDDQQPDAAVLWRWVWAATRPYLGYVLIGIGVILLLVAYFGASREIYVARQIPYLISGGLFGLGAVTLGSRLLLIEDMRRDSGRLDRLERAVADLHEALLTRPDAPAPTRREATGALNGKATERLLVLPGGESFHRPDCPVVAGKPSQRTVSVETAQRKGLRACPLCQPLLAGV